MTMLQETDRAQATSSRSLSVPSTTGRCFCFPIALLTLHGLRSSMLLWQLRSSTGLAIDRSAGICTSAVSTLLGKAEVLAKRSPNGASKSRKERAQSMCKRTMWGEEPWLLQQGWSHRTSGRSRRSWRRHCPVHKVDAVVIKPPLNS